MPLIDARNLTGDSDIECDICIIGSGAAGIAIARALVGTKARVVLLEAGSEEYSDDSQELYAGRSVGREYLDLTTCRLRYLGGTTNHWAGWCLPLSEADFEPREGIPYSGWPISRATLAPYYEQAAEVCELPRPEFNPSAWGIDASNIPAPFFGPHFRPGVIQESPPTRFGERYRQELVAAGNIDIYLNAPAINIGATQHLTAVDRVTIAPTSDLRVQVKAKHVVLASGGIENARLLLASNDAAPAGLGNDNDLVGRFFMVHIESWPATMLFAEPKVLTDLGHLHNAGRYHGQYVPHIGLSNETLRTKGIANTRILYDVRWAPDSPGVSAMKRLLGMEKGKSDGALSDIGHILTDLDDIAAAFYRKYVRRRHGPFDAMRLFLHSEQLPNPESRIRIGAERDGVGLPKTVVDWRLTAADKQSLRDTLTLLGQEVGRAGFARLRIDLPPGDDAWPEDIRGNEHHMGTTRMSDDPKTGVVDANCRVHGTDNLYVAGSSVFPTGGAANPTLTIVALALRLADHLKSKTL